MSRSYKKPYLSDQYTPGKKSANRAVRRTKDVADGKSYKKVYCTWNIRDWSFYCPTNPKARRK